MIPNCIQGQEPLVKNSYLCLPFGADNGKYFQQFSSVRRDRVHPEMLPHLSIISPSILCFTESVLWVGTVQRRRNFSSRGASGRLLRGSGVYVGADLGRWREVGVAEEEGAGVKGHRGPSSVWRSRGAADETGCRWRRLVGSCCSWNSQLCKELGFICAWSLFYHL